MTIPLQNYTDPGGNIFSNFSANGTVTPYGYHFKNPVATVQFVAYVLWLTCFTIITLGICSVRQHDKGETTGESNSHKYLRWPVIGLSTICMVLIYTLQVYNRIVHETEKRIRWYYPAVIGVLSNVLTGFAQGLLIAFLLWQLTPILLAHSKASARRSKWTILLCRTLTWLINFVNAADTIVTAMLWVMQIQQMFSNVKANTTEDKVNGISTINDAALTAAFTGMFLMCVVIFAAVAQGALKHLSTANKRFKVLLCLLTAAMIFRSLLDFVWALVFKVWALRQKLKFQETLTTNLVHTVLYGLFSVIIYASIVYIATLPLPPLDGDIAWQHLPEKERRWHLNRNSFRKRPEAVAQEVHKGSWTEDAATTTIEELMPKRDELIGYNGDPRYVDSQFLEAERTKLEERMHREETDTYTRRFHGGAEYRPAGVQGRY